MSYTERVRINVLLEEAYKLMEAATWQSHNGHWDMEGTRGTNCPECIRANKLRKQATAKYEEAWAGLRGKGKEIL